MAKKKATSKKPAAKKAKAPKPARAAAKKPARPPASVTAGTIAIVPIGSVAEDEFNIRRTFDPDKLKLLAEDIALRGIEQPITVTRADSHPDSHGLTVKHGARRLRAARLAGLKSVPVILVDHAAVAEAAGEDGQMRRLMDQLAENLQREDLNAIDLAHFFARLRDDFKIKISDMPALLKTNGMQEISRSHIQNTLALLELPKWAQEMMRTGVLTPAHGRPIKFAMQSEKVLALVKKGIEQDLKRAGDEDEYDDDRSGPPTAGELMRSVHNEFEELYFDLSNGPTYYNVPERVYYDPAKLTDQQRQELQIIELPSSYAGGKPTPYALNTAAHNKLNAEAQAVWEAKQKQKTDRANSKKAKAKNGGSGNDTANPVKLREHLHNYLQGWCSLRLPGEEEEAATQLMLLAWFAHGAPHVSFMNDPVLDDKDDADDCGAMLSAGVSGQHMVNGAKAAKLHKLHHFLQHDFRNVNDSIEAAHEAFAWLRERADALAAYMLQHHYMGVRDVATLAIHLGFNLDECFRVDDNYLKLHTKAGLDKLVRRVILVWPTLRDDWLKCRKNVQMRAFCVAHAEKIGVPPDIEEMWKDEITAPDEEDEALNAPPKPPKKPKKKAGRKAPAAGAGNDGIDNAIATEMAEEEELRERTLEDEAEAEQ